MRTPDEIAEAAVGDYPSLGSSRTAGVECVACAVEMYASEHEAEVKAARAAAYDLGVNAAYQEDCGYIAGLEARLAKCKTTDAVEILCREFYDGKPEKRAGRLKAWKESLAEECTYLRAQDKALREEIAGMGDSLILCIRDGVVDDIGLLDFAKCLLEIGEGKPCADNKQDN